MKNVVIRKIGLALVDALLCLTAFMFSTFLYPAAGLVLPNLLLACLGFMLLYVLCLWATGVYATLWRLTNAKDVFRLLCGGGIACILSVILTRMLMLSVPALVLLAASTMACLLSICIRLVGQLKPSKTMALPPADRRTYTTMVVGAGTAGAYLIGRLLLEYGRKPQQIILVEDDPAKASLALQGVRVRGCTAHIPALAKACNVQEIIIAIPSLTGMHLTQLVSLCTSTKVRVRIMRDAEQPENNAPGKRYILRELNTSDFLTRDEVQLDMEGISGYLMGKNVLVTGGGGSIGSELCRQIMRHTPKGLFILDIYENNAYALLLELQNIYGPDCPAQVLIGSVRDRERLDEVFRACQPDVVFHAAAHKHVPLMETSPAEAIKNNVIGTRLVLEACHTHHTDRFVLLSSDKAVNPTSVMGASKRVCELLVQAYAARGQTKCMAVRFGNVLGSHGSVIPLFASQIRSGGPVTVTDPGMTRFFMTIQEAAQLVLQAGGLAQSGAIYVLEMGRPVQILALAEQMIRFFGYEPGVNIEIVYTGPRPGEKLHEEVMTSTEHDALAHTAFEKIAIAKPAPMDEASFNKKLDMLVQAARNGSPDLHGILFDIVNSNQ